MHDNWHHPSDVATGLLLGGSCAAIAFGCYFGAPFGAPYGNGARAGYHALSSLSAAEGKAEEADCYRQMP